MRKKRVISIVAIAVTLVVGLGVIAWQFLDKNESNTTRSDPPSVVESNAPSLSKEEKEREEVISALSLLETKVESSNQDVFLEAFTPGMREFFTSADGLFTWSHPPGTDCIFKTETLEVNGETATVELEIGGEQFVQWLEKISGAWYLSYATTKE